MAGSLFNVDLRTLNVVFDRVDCFLLLLRFANYNPIIKLSFIHLILKIGLQCVRASAVAFLRYSVVTLNIVNITAKM